MKRDYPELEGKEIKFICSLGEYRGIVTGCNYDIGISIQDKDDMSEYLLCFIGKHAPNFGGFGSGGKRIHKKVFKNIVKQIQFGTYNTEITDKIFDEGLIVCGNQPKAEDCPFSQ